jgi:hypothetical protein
VVSRHVYRRGTNRCQVSVAGKWQLDWRRCLLQIACHPGVSYHTMPCRVGKHLDCVFPISITRCERVWFTHTMPCRCRAPTMPLCKRLPKARAQHGRGTAWYVWINIDRLSTACGRSAQFRFLPTTTRSFTIGSSDMALLNNGKGTARHVWISATWHGRGTAWYVCEFAFK